ncbi:MAG TPA: hypothetical protein PK587_06785 [Syntrophales bacterium]|nr:hypothetical protein [Syntrophales bacterium]
MAGDQKAAKNEERDIDQKTLKWLVGTPAGDVNFKSNLNRANEATIRAALAEISGKPGNKTAQKALERRLKMLLADKLDTVEALTQRQNQGTALEMGTLMAEREAEQKLKDEQTQREELIAQCYKVIGQIQAMDLVRNFTGVGTFSWLKQVKDSKIYKKLPEIGTWEKFCESVGISKSSADEGIDNLKTFGENFLTTCRQLSVSYHDIRQLRYLTQDGEVVLDQDANTITIADETIPIDEDHAEDLQAAIEKVIEQNTTLTQQAEKLKKGADEVVKEETKSLRAEVKALVKEVKRLKPFDPDEKDRSFCAEQMEEIKDATLSCIATMSKFIVRDDVQEDPVIMGQVEGHIQTLELCLADLRKRWEEKVVLFGRE